MQNRWRVLLCLESNHCISSSCWRCLFTVFFLVCHFVFQREEDRRRRPDSLHCEPSQLQYISTHLFHYIIRTLKFISAPLVGLRRVITVIASCPSLSISSADERPQTSASAAAAGPSETVYCPADDQCYRYFVMFGFTLWPACQSQLSCFVSNK